MRTFTINGRTIELDESLPHSDFWIQEGQPRAADINWESLLECLESGELKWNCETIDHFRLLSRWVNEAPRKRRFRELKRSGIPVISPEYFFEADGGDEFIDALERTGQMAAKVLEAHGVKPVGPIKNEGPRPVDAKEILSPSRRREIIKARFETFYRLRVDVRMSYEKIARLMKRDHTSVMHGVYKVRDRLLDEQSKKSNDKRLASVIHPLA